MNYLALYRKYRPNDLEEVVGQNEIKKILASSVKNGTITHAYLFSGPRGTGKTTMAKILAKMVNCEDNVDGNSCNKCNSCLNILKSNDVIEIDAASNNGVDEIRELREKATLVPANAKYKVYIIDEVHMLTTQAFNALLKILEEPPKHVIFILATTEYHKIPLTITSRCQKFQFSKINDEDIVNNLKYIAKKEKISIEDDALWEIAKLSDGGMRDSINFLDQLRSFSNKKIVISDVYDVCGNVSLLEMKDLLVDIRENKVVNVIAFFEKIDQNGKSYKKFFEDFVCLLKDIVLFKNNVSDKYLKFDVGIITEIEKLFSLDDIFYIIEKIDNLFEKIKFVSRQSVVVITDFLFIMNRFNNNSTVNDSYENAFEFTPENEMKDSKLTKEDVKSDNNIYVNETTKNEENESKEIINKDIIINNAFAVASKDIKISLQDKFTSVDKYLSDRKYSSAAGIMMDIVLEVAGAGYIIFSAKYDAIIDKINSNYELCSNFINKLFGDSYKFVVITEEEWNNYRNEYIKNIKDGKKYIVKKIETSIRKKEKKTTVVDKLFDLVGEDVIEFK